MGELTVGAFRSTVLAPPTGAGNEHHFLFFTFHGNHRVLTRAVSAQRPLEPTEGGHLAQEKRYRGTGTSNPGHQSFKLLLCHLSSMTSHKPKTTITPAQEVFSKIERRPLK